jgi:hypothetical protein
MASEQRAARQVAIRLAAFAIVVVLGCQGDPWAVEDRENNEGSVSVWVYPYVSPRPATVQVRIRLTPHHANRRLIVEVDSPAPFRSSLIPLEGSAPRVHWLKFEGLPAGEYVVTALLYRTEELTATAVDSFIVS